MSGRLQVGRWDEQAGGTGGGRCEFRQTRGELTAPLLGRFQNTGDGDASWCVYEADTVLKPNRAKKKITEQHERGRKHPKPSAGASHGRAANGGPTTAQPGSPQTQRRRDIRKSVSAMHAFTENERHVVL